VATKTTGQRGEQLAAAHLQVRGYRIIGANWRCKQGEIDIIAHDGASFIFVEVRTRHAESTSEAFESINTRKQQRMRAAVYAYLAAEKLESAAWRIDVIAVALPRSGHPIIEHVEDALDW
jgi:putative endonuclease